MEGEAKKTKRNIKPFNGEKYTIWKIWIRALIAKEEALQVLDEDRPKTVTEKFSNTTVEKQKAVEKQLLRFKLSLMTP